MTQIATAMTNAADALEAMQDNSVFRGENYLKVGKDFYVLSDLVEAAYELVSKTSDNPGFDMPQWFYSGSPYGTQIRALGVLSCQPPDEFIPEFLPQSEKQPWNRHASWWRDYATGLDAYTAKVWAEATAAAYGAAYEVTKSWYHNVGKGTPYAEIEALTPQSARDWLAAHDAEVYRRGQEDMRKRATEAVPQWGMDENDSQKLRDIISALPIKEKDND